MLCSIVTDQSAAAHSAPIMLLLDAAGTLIKLRGTVGDAYSRIASQFDVRISSEAIDHAFARLFPAQPPMIIPLDLSGDDQKHEEFLWWKNLARQVFHEAGSTAHFDEIFDLLFEYFRLPDAWIVYPDVAPALRWLRHRGYRLAVVSNFDSRLIDILGALKLLQFFERVHFSMALGFAKPDRRIFETVLRLHGLTATAVWHVGDSLRDDVAGAHAAGIRPIWLDRSGTSINNDRLTRIEGLGDLQNLLSKE